MTFFPVVYCRYYGSTNEIKSDEKEAPVTQVNQPLGSAVPGINYAADQPTTAEGSKDGTIQKNKRYSKPLRNKNVIS